MLINYRDIQLSRTDRQFVEINASEGMLVRLFEPLGGLRSSYMLGFLKGNMNRLVMSLSALYIIYMKQ